MNCKETVSADTSAKCTQLTFSSFFLEGDTRKKSRERGREREREEEREGGREEERKKGREEEQVPTKGSQN